MASVVLVEDDAAIRSSLTRALRDLGHVVTPVRTGVGGISTIMESRPDVVLLDLGLPDLDGTDVLRVSASVPPEERIAVFDAGREFDYTAGAELALERARESGWTVVSMKHDWAAMFSQGVPA
jgi:DNA-binding response OmpR family regulator